jgi:probable F420-dependent oxidoreductase
VSDQQAGTTRWRETLGPVGVWANGAVLGEDPGGFAGLVEQLGFGALWVGGGNPYEAAFDLLEAALSKTSRIVLATGITNIWAWEPADLARRAAGIESAHPGRFLLGIGVSHAPLVQSLGRIYERPLEAMAAFLDGLDAAGATESSPPRVLAALGRRMLELSRDRASGAHPYLAPPQHTARARQVLGRGLLLAPEQALVLESEPGQARVAARAYLERYLRLPNYRSNLQRLGYSDEDLAGSGSDRLTDALVPHGSAEEVAARVLAHLEAGADHVCIQPLAANGRFDAGALATLAPHLLTM